MNKIRVLLIDSDSELRETLAEFLELRDYRVDVADTAQAGLCLFEQGHPDVVLCDIDLDDMQGCELLARLRELDRSVPVIALSDERRLKYVVEVLRAGAFDFITKPIPDLVVLLTTINAALEKNNGQSEQEQLELAFAELKYNRAELQRDHAMASLFQLGMLPDSACTLGHCQIAWQMNTPRPMAANYFLDYFPVNNRYLSLYMADLTHLGNDKAFVSGALKVLFNEAHRSYQEDNNLLLLHPRAILGWIFYYLRSLKLPTLPGICYSLLDSRKNKLEWSDSGLALGPITWAGEQSATVDSVSERYMFHDGEQFDERAYILKPDEPLVFTTLQFPLLKASAEHYQTLTSVDQIARQLTAVSQQVMADSEQLSLVIKLNKNADNGASSLDNYSQPSPSA